MNCRSALAPFAAVLVLLGHGSGEYQSQGTKGREVSGVVVDSETGRPLANVRVGLVVITEARAATTGTDGRFNLPLQEAPSVALTFHRADYVDERISLTRIDTVSEQLLNVTVKLDKFSVISGRIEEEGGDAEIGARVIAFRRTFVGGYARFVRFGTEMTDDRGLYRISNLEAGQYIIGAVPVSGRTASTVTPTTYSPNLLQMSLARVIDLRPGASASANVTIPDIKGFSVAGVAAPIEGGRGYNAYLEPVGTEVELETSIVDSEGRFGFENVPPGDYAVRVLPLMHSVGVGIQTATGFKIPSNPRIGSAQTPILTQWGTSSLSVVDRNPATLHVDLRPGHTIEGRVTADGPEQVPKSIIGGPIMVMPANGRQFGSIPLTTVRADGSFATSGLPDGKYVMSFPLEVFGKYQVRSILTNGIETVGRAFALQGADVRNVIVTLTDRPTSLVGQLIGSSVLREFPTVCVFPTDPELWTDYGPPSSRLVTNPVALDGSFAFERLPPGEYFVALITRRAVRNGDWKSPDILRGLIAQAIRVKLETQASVTLRGPSPPR